MLYCGDKQELPQGYDGFDTRYNCLKKGIGVGRSLRELGLYQRYDRSQSELGLYKVNGLSKPNTGWRWYYGLLIAVFIVGVVALLIYMLL